MYVCICRQVTDHEIRDVCREGAVSPGIAGKAGCRLDCGKCGKLASTIVKNVVGCICQRSVVSDLS